CSRLAMKNPKTFENFDFSELSGKGVEKLRSITTLAPIYAHRNLAFIGPAGTGKTHLAMAFGYECCRKMMKTYFVKMTELNDMFTEARKYSRENRVISSLVKPSCLIIDEVGYCNFDTENTRLFFDMIDRRYNKEGNFNIIFTSNKQPKFWKQCFAEEAGQWFEQWEKNPPSHSCTCTRICKFILQ
ncbi:MAG: ATP-binding protein, partial [Spirochaetia bacterium]|nr:ATP-binding protein [Spirochaetia bacterium]